ncbi:MAG: DUF1792 domain-containing protein [Lachnospiraceae bacterium]|nr:DUF1792 domain-containing protein [Lachnospiraceae bacterium]
MDKIRKKFTIAAKRIISTCSMPIIYIYTRILQRVFPIKFYSEEYTLQKLIEGGSIGRFGDADLNIALGRGSVRYQEYSETLAGRLREILALDMNTTPGFHVALNPLLNTYHGYTKRSIRFWCVFNSTRLQSIYCLVRKNQIYYDALCFRVAALKEESYEVIEHRISKVKQIWEGKRILIVEGDMGELARLRENTCLGVGSDFLAGAKSIQRIIAPSRNAFAKYDEILETICRCYNHDLVLIVLGMTATVLAYDLYRRGIRAIDFGQTHRTYLQIMENLSGEAGAKITVEQWKEQIIEKID